MRTFEEVDDEITAAMNIDDAEKLRVLAMEMLAFATPTSYAKSQNALGVAAQMTGDYTSAFEHYVRALAIQEDLGERRGVAILRGNIGVVYRNNSDYPAALECFRQSLTLHEEIGNQSGVARAHSNLGLLYCDIGDSKAALEHLRRALALHEELDERPSVARDTGNMGVAYWHAGDYSMALLHYRRALALHEEIGNRASAARVTGNIILSLINLDQFDEAERLLESQKNMRIVDPGSLVQQKTSYATLASYRGDLDTARAHLVDALLIATEAGLREKTVSCHVMLRDLAQKRNDFADFVQHNAEYLRIREEIRGKEATQRLTLMEAERKMDAELRERNKERALLYGALPKSIADRMIRGEDVSGDHFEHAAVMFLDIVGFTSNTSHMPPNEVVKMLENIFGTIDGICDEHGVVKIKTIGDSYMCFATEGNGELGMGNSIERQSASPEQRVAAVALAVQQAEFYWPREASPEGLPEDSLDRLTFRIGIHRGPVTAGVIGAQRLQYDVWGDTVNVASRLESTSEPGRIHVSEAFATFLGLRPRNEDDAVPYDVRNGSSSAVDVERGVVIPNEVRNDEPGTWHLALRGETELKGKGTMTTYWLETV